MYIIYLIPFPWPHPLIATPTLNAGSQKRARTQEKVEEYDPPPPNGAKEARRDSTTATMSTNILTSPSSSSATPTTNTSSNKPIKKKIKAKKKYVWFRPHPLTMSRPHPLLNSHIVHV